jgi:hypothetical protein
MHIDELLRPHRRCLSEAKRSASHYFAHTADYVLSKIKMDYRRSSCSAQTDFIIRIIFETALSAFAACSAIPHNLLELIISPNSSCDALTHSLALPYDGTKDDELPRRSVLHRVGLDATTTRQRSAAWSLRPLQPSAHVTGSDQPHCAAWH